MEAIGISEIQNAIRVYEFNSLDGQSQSFRARFRVSGRFWSACPSSRQAEERKAILRAAQKRAKSRDRAEVGISVSGARRIARIRSARMLWNDSTDPWHVQLENLNGGYRLPRASCGNGQYTPPTSNSLARALRPRLLHGAAYPMPHVRVALLSARHALVTAHHRDLRACNERYILNPS